MTEQENPRRRVKMRFQTNGEPDWPSCKSPESFEVDAMSVLPPRDVIPVIFLPGVMGTNIKLKNGVKLEVDGKELEFEAGTKAWDPPASLRETIGDLAEAFRLTPAIRQIFYDPENTEVDYSKDFPLPDDLYSLDKEEAIIRGWGSLFHGAYLESLCGLEKTLNDRYANPGYLVDKPADSKQTEVNYLLDDIGVLQCLNECVIEQPIQTQGKGKKNLDPASAARERYNQKAAETRKEWSKLPAPLSEEEIRRLGQYYFPVWAFGYNWLQSNADSAQKLIEFIEGTVLPRYQGKYFRHQGKVIMVTHSMGGLVGRWAATVLRPDLFLGVVHGVCPMAGAPIVYRRFRAGTEFRSSDIGEWGFAVLAGRNAEEFTPELACAPGPQELLPTPFYPKGWLRFVQKKLFGKPVEITRLPKEDPYEEIYKKTTDDCWWGMLDPALIDPAGLIREKNKDPLKTARDTIDTAKTFQTTLGRQVHPNTYGFYGNDNKKFKAFGYVVWETSHPGKLPPTEDLMSRTDLGRTTKGKAWISGNTEDARIPAAPPAGWEDQPPTPDQGTIRFQLVNEKNQAGDGTVPQDSALFFETIDPKLVIASKGYIHNDAYKQSASPYSWYATIYGVIRIVQDAAPPLPKDASEDTPCQPD